MKKQIAILGSTGSIGTQALQVIEEQSDQYEAYVLTANNRVEELIAQARKFKPEAVVIANETKYAQLKEALADLPIKVYAGTDAICQIVEDSEIVLVISAGDIEKNKVRGDLGITYDADVLRLIDAFRGYGLYVGSVVLTQFSGQASAVAYEKKLEGLGICVAVVSLFYFFHAEKAEAEKRMVEIVNYVKVQCSTTPIIMNLRNPKVSSVPLKVPDK